MERLKMQSRDVIGSNIQKIAQLFPQCVTERLGKDGKPELGIDFEKLQAELSDEVIGEGEERYQFTWPDKRAAARLANIPTTMTLRPCRAESVDFDHTQNLYIEGDNLDVLKVLRETYLGKVKMIYIDPPYNTGNDFVYNDGFNVLKEKEEERNGLYDEDGYQILSKYERNVSSNGRFHTDWLNMMYPRLKVARDLLTEDGTIFISIDDNEVRNLKNICDEIFGGCNFRSNSIVINNRGGRDYGGIALQHDYILIYTKSQIGELNLIEEKEKQFQYYDSKGGFNLMELRNRNVKFNNINRPNLCYPFYINPNNQDMNGLMEISLEPKEGFVEVYPAKSNGIQTVWRWGKEEKSRKNLNINIFGKTNQNGGYMIVQKYRKTTKMQRSIWDEKEFVNERGTEAVKELFNGKAYFDYPKSVFTIKRVLEIGGCDDGMVLDFFSGSATTAHAVMQLNAEDGGNRKFIMVQLPELTDEKSEAYKAGYKNICEIGKERIRRAGKKIKADSPLTTQNLDVGFRVLKLDSSNMLDVYYTPEEFNEKMIFQENVKADRTDEDLLFQVMLELGIELSVSIRQERLGPQRATVFNVDDGYLMATFEQEIDEATITEIAKRNPGFFVMRDASAASDNVLDNFEQLFRHYSPETSCRII